jgi:hypothetical protein
MDETIISREEIEVEVKCLDRSITVLSKGAVERTPDWHIAMNHYTQQREVLVDYLKRIDSTDAF